MSVSYDLFTKAFLGKITEYELMGLDEDMREDIVDSYMIRACSEFNRICQYDLLNRDNDNRLFLDDIDDSDIDEIVNIVSEGMVVQWLKPYMYKSENLENVLNTSDYSVYSPAELLLRVTNTYDSAKRAFKNMCFEYSYNHASLEDLWL